MIQNYHIDIKLTMVLRKLSLQRCTSARETGIIEPDRHIHLWILDKSYHYNNTTRLTIITIHLCFNVLWHIHLGSYMQIPIWRNKHNISWRPEVDNLVDNLVIFHDVICMPQYKDNMWNINIVILIAGMMIMEYDESRTTFCSIKNTAITNLLPFWNV